MTVHYDHAKAAFHQASLFIEESGIGKDVENWVQDLTGHIRPLRDLEARVVLAGWLAALIAGVPPTDSNVTDLVNAFFDEYDTSEQEMYDFNAHLRFALHVSGLNADQHTVTA